MRRTPSGSPPRRSGLPFCRAPGSSPPPPPLRLASPPPRPARALGASLAGALLAHATGAMIWVRPLTPDIEIEEERHDLNSAPADRAAFQKDFAEGAAISQITRRPLLRRTMLLATAPLALAPLVLLRDLGPLPQTDLRHTVWRKGLHAVTLGGLNPLRPADISTPGSMITVIPQGYQNDDNALAMAGVILIKFAPGERHVTTPCARRHRLS